MTMRVVPRPFNHIQQHICYKSLNQNIYSRIFGSQAAELRLSCFIFSFTELIYKLASYPTYSTCAICKNSRIRCGSTMRSIVVNDNPEPMAFINSLKILVDFRFVIVVLRNRNRSTRTADIYYIFGFGLVLEREI